MRRWSVHCVSDGEVGLGTQTQQHEAICDLSHKMIDKSHAVPRFSLKLVGVNLGEIEMFALRRSSFIFTPYTCSFLLYSTHKCFKFCK